MTYSDRMTQLARIGFAARGLVYLLVGWFALDAALHGGETTDNQGAMGTLADAPLGHILLAVCALGFAGYAVWRLTEAITDPENRGHTLKGKFERLGYALSGISHIMLATAAGQLALAQTAKQRGSPGDESAQGWSAWLLEQPGGALLLMLVGVLLLIVAVAQALKAYKAKFDDLDGDVPVPDYVRWVGRLGYAARALVFSLIGWFVISAALNHDPDRAGGLGEALAQLRAQDEGTLILSVVALGLGLFGVFSLIEARYRRMKVKTPNFLR